MITTNFTCPADGGNLVRYSRYHKCTKCGYEYGPYNFERFVLARQKKNLPKGQTPEKYVRALYNRLKHNMRLAGLELSIQTKTK